MNIKETQKKIWNGVTKDVGYIRKILNEVYFLKFKVRRWKMMNNEGKCVGIMITGRDGLKLAGESDGDFLKFARILSDSPCSPSSSKDIPAALNCHELK
jgi:hypothetical protein